MSKHILPLLPANSYRLIAYVATAITGFVALCAQTIWQRHLAILTGSEAKSLSLVIAIFLLGLAGGYYVFGLLTNRKQGLRFQLLKYYGYIEMLTGLYIGLFPFYFEFLKRLSFNSANLLIIDILISFMALLLPTFLMGASIPLLTATLPDNSKEVNTVHAKVYGWNSFGACFGVLVSGFYLIPFFGLNLSLNIIGILNVLASLVFIGNGLSGLIHKQEELPTIPSPLPNMFFMIFVFLTGALVISFEVIFVRILNLSIGSGVYNFPMVLAIFVGALALGSLSIKKQKLSIKFFTRQLLIILALLQVLFLTAPYWSIWFNHIRISLVSISSNYLVYYILIFLFLLLFLFPAVFFMGRLLPLVYSFLKKTKDNYGKVCGFLYFFNTLGTVFGAVVIGYLAFYLFNLDILFKVNIYILFLLALTVIIYTKNKSALIALSVLGLTLIGLPTQWNRAGHEVGYFRTKIYNPKMHFRGVFFLPSIQERTGAEASFFKDGPNTTVSLINYKKNEKENWIDLESLFSYSFETISSYSIIVNGKSDGNSLGDFSTVFFMLPYLYAPQKTNLKTAFIGLGTGISAGAYTPLEDVESIDVLEISPFVTKAIKTAPPELNFNVMKNQKVKIIETDAFKYFTRTNKKFDIIISEPSNPWVVGVENLFTLEFYNLISQNLNEGGIFGQWLHTYSMDVPTIQIVIKTINQVFPHANLYQVGHKDILIVAGLNKLPHLSRKRFNHPFVKKFYKAMGFQTTEDLYLSQILNSYNFNQAANLTKIIPEKKAFKKSWFKKEQKHFNIFFTSNSFIYPQLIYRANKAMFLNSQVDPFHLVNKFHIDEKKETEKTKAFNKYANRESEDWSKRCLPISGFNFLCGMMIPLNTSWKILKNKEKTFSERFAHYILLRRQKLINYNKEIMNGFFNETIKEKNANLDHLSNYVFEKIKMKDYEGANRDSLTFKSKGLINESHYKNFKKDLESSKKIHAALEKAD